MFRRWNRNRKSRFRKLSRCTSSDVETVLGADQRAILLINQYVKLNIIEFKIHGSNATYGHAAIQNRGSRF
ncbi:Uncharacterised protein [Vibrio cholerae]|nr:Uncharacterised protein [Vibrio cholerae]